MSLSPPDDLARRFRASLTSFVGEPAVISANFGLAVSGGSDSLALLLLAAAALPGRVAVATVDHRFRPESQGEATVVAEVCARLGIAHDILPLTWVPPRSNRQASARDARYDILAKWAQERGVGWLVTAHHTDDQAETLLMRLHRGSGVDGLAGIRPMRALGDDLMLVRPLLTWRKSELGAVVAACGLTPVEDPTNTDPSHDRTGARAFLAASADWPDRGRLAASADHLRESSEALTWTTEELLRSRVSDDGAALLLDVRSLPSELLRRLALRMLQDFSPAAAVRGDDLARALDRLRTGDVVTLAGVVVRPGGDGWRFEPAPPRRS